MNTLEISGSLELREAPAGSELAATVEGLAVPYGVTTQLGQLRESFAPGAVDPAQAIGMPLCWRHGDPIGVITDARNTDQGLHITAEITDTTLGRDAVKLLRSKALKGLSVGFTPIEDAWTRSRDAVTRVRVALGEISLTHLPGYATAGVSIIREETPMPEQAETTSVPEQAPSEQRELQASYATQDELQALRDRVASMRTTEQPTQGKDGESFLREYGQALLTRAWTDITLDGTASDFKPIPSECQRSGGVWSPHCLGHWRAASPAFRHGCAVDAGQRAAHHGCVSQLRRLRSPVALPVASWSAQLCAPTRVAIDVFHPVHAACHRVGLPAPVAQLRRAVRQGNEPGCAD